MKTSTLSLPVFLFLALVSQAQNVWFGQNPFPTGEFLKSGHFTDASTGWAVGSGGNIFKTGSNGSLSPLDLISPAHSASGIDLSPTLIWSKIAAAWDYRNQIATDLGLTALILDHALVNDTSRTVSPPLARGTAYNWRVNARNTGGESVWSTIRT